MDSYRNDVVSLYSDEDFNDLLKDLHCTSEDECNLDNQNCNQQVKRRRKRVRKPYIKLPGLNIVKDDIRRAYAGMITNVLNSNDFPLTFGFLQTFYVPNVKSSIRKVGALDEGFCFSYSGMTKVAQHCYNTIKLSPDSTFDLKHATVDYRTGQIVLYVLGSCTLLYEDESVAAISQLQDWVSDSDKVEGDVNDALTMKKIMNNVDKSMNNLVLRSNPQRITAPSTVYIGTDEHKRITSFDIVIDCVDETLIDSFIVYDNKRRE